MKIAGIAGLLAVVTAVTGAAIPNVNTVLNEVHQATDGVNGLLGGNLPTPEVKELTNKLEKVEAALKGLQNEKRDVGNLVGGAEDLVHGLGLKRGILSDVPEELGLAKRDDAISGLAGQLLPQLTQNGLLPQVTDLKQLTGLLNVLQANSLIGDLQQVLTSLLSGALGDVLPSLKRDDPISSLAGQLLPQLTQSGILPEVTDLKQLTGLLNVLQVKGLLSNVTNTLNNLLSGLGLQGLPVVGDLAGILKRDDPISSLAGQLLPQLTQSGILPEVTDLKQLTGLLNVLQAKGLLSNVTNTLNNLLSGLGLQGLPVVGDLAGILKRDDAISGLAGQLLPQLTQNGLLPQVTDLKQLTGLLNVLQANSLIGDLQQVLTSLLGQLPIPL